MRLYRRSLRLTLRGYTRSCFSLAQSRTRCAPIQPWPPCPLQPKHSSLKRAIPLPQKRGNRNQVPGKHCICTNSHQLPVRANRASTQVGVSCPPALWRPFITVGPRTRDTKKGQVLAMLNFRVKRMTFPTWALQYPTQIAMNICNRRATQTSTVPVFASIDGFEGIQMCLPGIALIALYAAAWQRSKFLR